MFEARIAQGGLLKKVCDAAELAQGGLQRGLAGPTAGREFALPTSPDPQLRSAGIDRLHGAMDAACSGAGWQREPQVQTTAIASP